jgi:hypothetical protein
MNDYFKGQDLDTDLRKRIDWAMGKLLLAIGAGKAKEELSLIVQILETNAIRRSKEKP